MNQRPPAPYRISGVDARLADSLVDRYTGSRMVGEERARSAKRLENEARLRARFIDGPTLALPVAHSFNFSFDPSGATPLPGVGTVYETSRITDDWGVLEVSSGGVLLVRGSDGLITGVIVPAPLASDRTVTGGGWQLKLAPGWSAKEGPRKRDFVVTRD